MPIVRYWLFSRSEKGPSNKYGAISHKDVKLQWFVVVFGNRSGKTQSSNTKQQTTVVVVPIIDHYLLTACLRCSAMKMAIEMRFGSVRLSFSFYALCLAVSNEAFIFLFRPETINNNNFTLGMGQLKYFSAWWTSTGPSSIVQDSHCIGDIWGVE